MNYWNSPIIQVFCAVFEGLVLNYPKNSPTRINCDLESNLGLKSGLESVRACARARVYVCGCVWVPARACGCPRVHLYLCAELACVRTYLRAYVQDACMFWCGRACVKVFV